MNTINENGYPEPQDVIVCKTWASVVDAGNQHFRSADVVNTEGVINFTIRFRRDVKPGMWVYFNGEKWTITELPLEFKDCVAAFIAIIVTVQSTPNNTPTASPRKAATMASKEETP